MPLSRPLFLTGMMGTGKSVLGQSIAARTGLPFVDLDKRIEARAGMSIARIFQERGEAAFRVIERSLLEAELADPSPRVVALGGGTLLDRDLRLRALEKGLVVALQADAGELLRRLGTDRNRPLLEGGDREARLRSLLEARAPAYAEAHAVVDVTSRGVLDVTLEVLAMAQTDRVAVALGERSYAVEIALGKVKEALAVALTRLRPTRVVLVTDETVAGLHLPRVEGVLEQADPEWVRVVLPPGEKHKTMASLETVLRAAVEAKVDRGAVLVAMGGGVITDLGGLAAALALRGIRWIGVPTTTLAMADASVGGKTAVDLGPAKNAVGAFHQPAHVVVDPSLSRTESLRAYRSGLAEVAKAALLGAPDVWDELSAQAERLGNREDDELLARALRAAIQVKATIVSRDEKEAGERAHLNLGHTVGHALEVFGEFERWTHGEAVALGLVAAMKVGEALAVTPKELGAQVTSVLERLGLPTTVAEEELRAALRWVEYDKKRVGKAIKLVLLRAPGVVETVAVAPSRLSETLCPDGTAQSGENGRPSK